MSVDHLRALFVQTPAVLAGNLVGVALTVAIFWPLAGRERVLGWALVVGVLWLLRLLLRLLLLRLLHLLLLLFLQQVLHLQHRLRL